jgi:hypothetical protein
MNVFTVLEEFFFLRHLVLVLVIFSLAPTPDQGLIIAPSHSLLLRNEGELGQYELWVH